MPSHYTKRAIAPGISYTPAGPDGAFADPLAPVTVTPGRYSVLPKIPYATMPGNEYTAKRYPYEMMPTPNGMTLPVGNYNPIQMGVSLGIAGAAAGLGSAAITESIRRWHGERGRMGGPAVLKRMLVGGAIGTALGAYVGASLNSQTLRPGSWDDVAKMLQTRSSGLLTPSRIPAAPEVPAVSNTPAFVPGAKGAQVKAAQGVLTLGERAAASIPSLWRALAVWATASSAKGLSDAHSRWQVDRTNNVAAADSDVNSMLANGAMIPMSILPVTKLRVGSRLLKLPVIGKLLAKSISAAPAAAGVIETNPWTAEGRIMKALGNMGNKAVTRTKAVAPYIGLDVARNRSDLIAQGFRDNPVKAEIYAANKRDAQRPSQEYWDATMRGLQDKIQAFGDTSKNIAHSWLGTPR